MTHTPSFSMMPWYPAAFMGATLGWPLVARGVFRELLDAQWMCGGLNPGVLPEQPTQLRDLARATPGEWRTAWPLVETKFPVLPSGGRQNSRLEQHRQEAVRRYYSKRRGAEATNLKLGRASTAAAPRAPLANNGLGE